MCDYARAVQARIESLNLPKAVRKDAVVLCGLIVTSDLPFFARLPPEEQQRFFEGSRDFLARFVGQENVISAMIHMDEKTPHMHFLHVPVTPDGRLRKNYEELEKRKVDADEEIRQLKQFIAQPDEKPRFEKFLADKQEEELRAEMERQTCLTTRKPAPAHEDGGPSFSPR